MYLGRLITTECRGQFAIACAKEHFFRGLLTAIDRTDLADDGGQRDRDQRKQQAAAAVDARPQPQVALVGSLSLGQPLRASIAYALGANEIIEDHCVAIRSGGGDLPGLHNVVADSLSRDFHLSHSKLTAMLYAAQPPYLPPQLSIVPLGADGEWHAVHDTSRRACAPTCRPCIAQWPYTTPYG